jgi:phosphohistidine phosphatase
MRFLLLMRHAKADPLAPGGSDFDRVLAPRGRSDAKTMGTYLARHRLVPDCVVVSPAARTRETWTQTSTAFGQMPPASFEDRLYDAAAPAVLDVIKQTADSVGTLLVIGHNPGLQELAAMLIASGDVETRERLSREFPTSAMATISFAVENWNAVHARGGRLEHFITPKWLRATSD